MATKWKPVPGFEGLYVVSDDGQVARIATHGRNPKPIWRVLRADTKNGYVYVDLSMDNETHRFYVHHLVWEAFKGPIPRGMEVNHKNGIRSDNRLKKLELLTPSENMLHMFQHLNPSLNRTKGSIHHKSKLSEDDVRSILAMRRARVPGPAIAKMFGVSKTAIYLIMKGQNWKHLTGLGSRVRL